MDTSQKSSGVRANRDQIDGRLLGPCRFHINVSCLGCQPFKRSASLRTLGQLEVVGRLQYPFGVSLQVAFNFGADLHIFNQYE